MDIKCKLRFLIKKKEIEEERELTYDIIYEETGIHPATLSALVNDKTRRFDAHVLARLCKYLNCQVGDLLVYVPDEEEGQ